jgi:Co/Zn/Cd efflux system component
VLADAATSVVAIAALISARYFHSPWLDPVMGFAGSVMIILVVRVDQEIFFRASRS